MATLKMVQESMNGNAKAPAQQQNLSATNFYAPPTEVPTVGEQKYVLFRLVKKKVRRFRLDGICDSVLNPKTNRRERIWLLNGADSIWQSELMELLKDKEYVNKNRRSLLFEDGICRIYIDDDRALEFARANKNNVGKNRGGSGKYDFYEYDAHEEQKMRFDKQMLKINTVLKVKDLEEEKVKKVASFLGIVFFDELGQPKGIDGIRTELLIKADLQPELVNKYIDSQEVEIAYMVKRAIIEAKIDLTGQNGNALWAGGKGFIAKIPSNRKAYEYLTELAMTNSDEGRVFKEQLQTMM